MFLRDAYISELLVMDQFEKLGQQLYADPAHRAIFEPRTYDEFLQFVSTYPLPDNSMLKHIYSQIKSTRSLEQETLTSKFDVEFHKVPRYYMGTIHSHDYFELLYIVQGTCTQLVQNTHLNMCEGDFMILSPEVPHYVQIADDNTLAINITIRRSTFESVFFGLFSDNDILSNFFTKVLYGKHPDPYIIFQTAHDHAVMAQVFDLMYEYEHPVPYSRQAINNGISNLFIHLLRYHQQRAYTGGGGIGHNSLVLPILQYVQSHCETVTLQMLSEEFHYQPAYISREIKKATGMTFSEIKQRLRLQRAADLLATTTLSFGYISDTLGYTDTSHFYKQFKHCFGITPKLYRERNAHDIRPSMQSDSEA